MASEFPSIEPSKTRMNVRLTAVLEVGASVLLMNVRFELMRLRKVLSA